MTQLLYRPKSSIRKVESDNLFSGIWIRWRVLTVGERFVCANIVLWPVWWFTGLHIRMPLLLLLGVVLYEFWQHRELRLKRPSLPVVASFVFGVYEVARLFLLFIKIRQGMVDVFLFTFIPTFWLWYIQSNNIRIRLKVVAWALTVSVVQMFGLWLLIQFVLPDSFFFPPQVNLLGRITGYRQEVVRDDLINADAAFDLMNLVPYAPHSNGMLGFDRFSMFFAYPEFFGLVVGFIAILALDIRNRLWSWLLFSACVFLIVLSATRIVVFALPIVLGLRYVFSNFRNLWGPPIIFALMAVVSFTTLSLPQANLVGKITQPVQAVNQVRENSTKTRFEIYRATWKAIQERPFLGYRSKGAGSSAADFGTNSRIGSHSTILGTLMYQRGLIGTVLFTVFWISLFIWFYKTRAGRPTTCFCVLIYYGLVSSTMSIAYEMPASSLLILLCAAMRYPQLRSVKGIKSSVSS